MRCGWGWTPAECIEAHWCPALGAHAVGIHWRARCPLCDGNDAFEISIGSAGVAWNCWTKPKCDHDEIRLLLDDVLPCRKGRRSAAVLSELRKVIGLPDCALRLRVACLVWNLPPKDAAAKLGMSRRTYYRAMAALPDLARKAKK